METMYFVRHLYSQAHIVVTLYKVLKCRYIFTFQLSSFFTTTAQYIICITTLFSRLKTTASDLEVLTFILAVSHSASTVTAPVHAGDPDSTKQWDHIKKHQSPPQLNTLDPLVWLAKHFPREQNKTKQSPLNTLTVTKSCTVYCPMTKTRGSPCSPSLSINQHQT